MVWTITGNKWPSEWLDGAIVGKKIEFINNSMQAVIPNDDYIIIDGNHQFKEAP